MMLAGLRQYGNFPLPARADMNDVLISRGAYNAVRYAGSPFSASANSLKSCSVKAQLDCQQASVLRIDDSMSPASFDYVVIDGADSNRRSDNNNNNKYASPINSVECLEADKEITARRADAWAAEPIPVTQLARETSAVMQEINQSGDGVERLERLEGSTSTGGLDSPELSFAVKKDIVQIQSICVEMDRLWRSVASKAHRDLWKRKVEQVAEEVESLRHGLDKYIARNQRRTTETKESRNGESAHVLRIFDEESQAMSVRNSSRMLEESFATGTTILSKYAEQRDRLKFLQNLSSIDREMVGGAGVELARLGLLLYSFGVCFGAWSLQLEEAHDRIRSL
ncbi:hypothetical protein ACFE04_023070 [Oxalis oulophora]